ncbi:hypothetical protein [Lysinibacillus agricola]|uniref:hypothetical protein n=1 Tax=Lysinibacillus agricola TaxID=2590012 RepID=UPI003C178671
MNHFILEEVGVVAVQASGNIQNVAAASEEQSASIEEITSSELDRDLNASINLANYSI